MAIAIFGYISLPFSERVLTITLATRKTMSVSQSAHANQGSMERIFVNGAKVSGAYILQLTTDWNLKAKLSNISQILFLWRQSNWVADFSSSSTKMVGWTTSTTTTTMMTTIITTTTTTKRMKAKMIRTMTIKTTSHLDAVAKKKMAIILRLTKVSFW